MTNLDSILKSRHYFANKGPSSRCYGFSSSHVWMWELEHKECWTLKKWYFWTVVLEKTLESPLDCKEIQPIHPKGKQSWIFIGRTDAESETPILWPPDAKSDSFEKTLMLGKLEDRRRRGQQDEMVGLWRRLSTEELMLLDCGVGEDSWESLGLQGDPTSPF